MMTEFDTLENYLKLSEALIGLYSPISIRDNMLNSEDAIANVANSLMMADWKWNGKGSKHGYRKQRCEWAIKRWIHQQCKRKTFSLDSICKGSDHNLLYFLVDSKKTPLNNLITKEYLEGIKQKLASYSNQRHSEFFQLYLDGHSFAEIGRKHNITRERVRQIINKVGERLSKT